MVGTEELLETLVALEAERVDQLATLTPESLTYPWIKACVDVAWKLFPRCRLGRDAFGSVILLLSDGRYLALCAFPDVQLNGVAYKTSSGYRAVVNGGGLQALFEFAAAIWLDRRICPHLGSLDALPAVSGLHADIPLGFEHVWSLASRSKKPNSPPELPDWLKSNLQALCRQRAHAFERTFLEGVRFFWLHEIAHVLGGHVDLRKQAQGLPALTEFDEALYGAERGIPAAAPLDYLHALEIQADRYALDRLFEGALRRQPNEPGHPDERIFTILGASMVPLLLHSRYAFTNVPDMARQHPSVWFRADEVLRAEDKAWREWAQANLEATSVDHGQRFRERGFLVAILRRLGETHPMLD